MRSRSCRRRCGNGWRTIQPVSIARSCLAICVRFSSARSRFAEDELRRAVVERGVRQYVVLGAGFDPFALRNPFVSEGLRVFELDHPATQKAKLTRLAAAGIEPRSGTIFAPVDLSAMTVDQALDTAGFDRTQPSFFAWLGVSMYLELEAIGATLRAIAALPKATVVFDFAPRPRWYEILPRVILAIRAARGSPRGAMENIPSPGRTSQRTDRRRFCDDTDREWRRADAALRLRQQPRSHPLLEHRRRRNAVNDIEAVP